MNKFRFFAIVAISLLIVIFSYTGIVYAIPQLIKDPDKYYIYETVIIVLLLVIPYVILKLLFYCTRAKNEPELRLKDLPKSAKTLRSK